ncbi:MAG: hypothetical protein NTV80_24140 [Verrucomicrobia bacterium]|nr:hypothetical protein [Verrucomicrobiota bacterium]
MIQTLQSLPSRQLNPRLGSPYNGVLEGRERLAGGETTGSSAEIGLSLDRAPAGARETSASPTSAMTKGVLGRFSRPSRALTSPTKGGRRDPVVSPPANLSRASGTPAADQFIDVNKLIPNHFPDVRKMPHIIVALLAFALISCGKKEAPKPTVEAPKPAAVSEAKIDAAIADALTPAAPTAPSKSDLQAGLEAQAEDILAKHPNKNGQDLLGVPELQEALKAGLTKLSKDKNLQNQINQSVSLAAKMKGLSGEPGTVGLDLDLKGYDHARKSRMVQAVISEDPKQIVRFLTEEIGEAAPELSFGGAPRASNGVALKETPLPAK